MKTLILKEFSVFGKIPYLFSLMKSSHVENLRNGNSKNNFHPNGFFLLTHWPPYSSKIGAKIPLSSASSQDPQVSEWLSTRAGTAAPLMMHCCLSLQLYCLVSDKA